MNCFDYPLRPIPDNTEEPWLHVLVEEANILFSLTEFLSVFYVYIINCLIVKAHKSIFTTTC